MPPKPISATKPPLQTRILQRVRAFREWTLRNLILSVMTALVVDWLVVSWLVYRVEHKAQGANITTFADAVWWGVVTFLTVGYGDKYPVTNEARVWAGSLMFVGVFGVAIITSKISSYFLEQVLREGRGVVNTAKLKNHLVICGWKDDMHELLGHILDFNPQLESKDLVVVANLQPKHIEAIHEIPRLKNTQFVVGEYYQAVTLSRAAPERARKVLILADRTPGPTGTIPSPNEVDARTIMTAMTVHNLNRGTLVAAEILDPKMDQYLKFAHVTEIIYSREYSRLLLGNVSGGTGVSNILFDLLDPKTATVITTHPIPDALLLRPYPEFKAAYEKAFPEAVVIGILEHTGNDHHIKELALRQAQRTPDVSRLVSNLRAVKEIKCNHPVFNPGADYVVGEGSMAIVIETRTGYAASHASSSEASAAA